jgi:hypothetical protein
MAVDAPTPVGSSTSRTAVTGAIRQAARVTGVSFDYLLATAKVESDLNPNLTVRTSTATGLFQFIEQTWLATLKQGGPAFGYGDYADAISRTPTGRYVVEDPALRSEIMLLRKDPTANALMGGVVTQKNASELAKRIGRKPTEDELYVAHFFGPYAGATAIRLAGSDPTANAAAIFPHRRPPTARSSTTGRAMRAASPGSAPSSCGAIRWRAPRRRRRRCGLPGATSRARRAQSRAGRRLRSRRRRGRRRRRRPPKPPRCAARRPRRGSRRWRPWRRSRMKNPASSTTLPQSSRVRARQSPGRAFTRCSMTMDGVGRWRRW